MNSEKLTRIMMVDDHQILTDGIKKMLEGSEFAIVAEAQNSHQALALLETCKIDILITDIQMPGDDGIELIKKAKKKCPGIKYIVLSMHEEKSIVLDAVELGVHAYLLKNITQQQLLLALNRVNAGKFYASEEVANILANKVKARSNRRLLSNREMDILSLMAKEYTNRQIADSLSISERTVETHRKNIFTKTGTKTIAGLIQFAMKNELI